MSGIFMLIVTGLTSFGVCLLGLNGLQLSGRDLRKAIGKMLECVGMSLIFCAVNLLLAVVVILVVRGLTKTFVSLYLVNDMAWLGLSLIQGLTFQWWRELSESG